MRISLLFLIDFIGFGFAIGLGKGKLNWVGLGRVNVCSEILAPSCVWIHISQRKFLSRGFQVCRRSIRFCVLWMCSWLELVRNVHVYTLDGVSFAGRIGVAVIGMVRLAWLYLRVTRTRRVQWSVCVWASWVLGHMQKEPVPHMYIIQLRSRTAFINWITFVSSLSCDAM